MSVSVSLSKFFLFCGDYISHRIKSRGEYPHRTFISVFDYKNGVAEFDGKDWSCQIFVKE